MPVIYNEFEIGDEVVIVDEPYDNCPFGWVGAMDCHCSEETVILSKTWSCSENTYKYEIEADNGFCWWCGNCFKSKERDTEFEAVDRNDLLGLLGV